MYMFLLSKAGVVCDAEVPDDAPAGFDTISGFVGIPGVDVATVQPGGDAAAALAARRVLPDELPAQAQQVVLLAVVGDVRAGVINGGRTLITVRHRVFPSDAASASLTA
jgi:hypothetical protein